MFRYLPEPRNILVEPLGSPEPRLKNPGLQLFCYFTYFRPGKKISTYTMLLNEIFLNKILNHNEYELSCIET